jgi:hypothetical protein
MLLPLILLLLLLPRVVREKYGFAAGKNILQREKAGLAEGTLF